MRTTSRAVLFVGLASTVVVYALSWFPTTWFLNGRTLEWWTQDLRFKHAQLPATHLSDQVRLVAIDDRAIDTYGRWPWSRAVIAEAVDEIGRAGASTLATDVLFTEPQGDRLSGTQTEADMALQAAFKGVPTVLAVQMDEGRLLGDAWRDAEGQGALRDLTAAVATDVTADPEELARRLNLQDDKRASFLARPSAFKKYALWRTLVERRKAGDVSPELAAFRMRVTGGDQSLGRFAEEVSVAEAFDRDRSFALLQRHMHAGLGEGSPLDAPPISVFSEVASGVGFVTSREDPDGQYRRVRPLWRGAYGELAQMGLAAAIQQQRQSVSKLSVEDEVAIMPDGWRLPLKDGAVYVDWPSTMFEPVGAEAREEALHGTGVVAIGALVDLARQRVTLKELEARYRELVQEIATNQNLTADQIADTPVAPAVRAAIKDQGEFLSGGDLAQQGSAGLDGLSDDEKKLIGMYREWWRLDGGIVHARQVIAKAEHNVKQELNGKLVFVGFMATGQAADMINTVYGPRTPGVYFHAAIASMALEHKAVSVAPWWTGMVLGLLLGVISSVLVSRFSANISLIVMGLLLGSYVVVAGVWVFNAFHFMAPMAVPVLSGGLAQLAGLSTAAYIHQRERARITRQFRARVSSQLVDQLVKNPDALSVRGEQRMACILFGDLAGFTTISEKLGSEAVVATLNLYMGALAKELADERAYVNKFLGDGLLAFWSAFGAEPQQCKLALRACVECQKQVKAIGQRPDRAGLPPVSLRLGIATGVVTIGDCGAPPELNDYTVIGDAANLAARLESANKQFGTAILMDGQTRAGVDDTTGLELVRLGRVVVVGQSVPVELFTMLVEPPAAGWIDAVNTAVAAFEKGDFAACAAAWNAMEQRFGASKLSQPFRYAMEDSTDPRDGVLRLRAK